jgi:hypothetical protein
MVGDMDKNAVADGSSPASAAALEACAGPMQFRGMCSATLVASGRGSCLPPDAARRVEALASTGFMWPPADIGDNMKDADRRAGSRTRLRVACRWVSADVVRFDTLVQQLLCISIRRSRSHRARHLGNFTFGVEKLLAYLHGMQ